MTPLEETRAAELVERTRRDWDGRPPVWVEVLAHACVRDSQSKVAGRIGYSSPVVNAVLRNAYRGNIDRVEQAVRGGLMSETVECPVLETIGRADCLRHQRRKLEHCSTNTIWPKVWRACRSGCPHSSLPRQFGKRGPS